MTTTSRGRRSPELLKGPPASAVSEDPGAALARAEAEAARQAQLKAVAEVEASMAGQAELEVEAIEQAIEEVEAEPTPEERYEARLKSMPPDEPRWRMGVRGKNMRVEDYVLSPGDIVPGANDWPRRDSWESAGYIERV